MYTHITERYTPEKKKNNNTNSKGYMHPNVHSNTIYNNQDREATQLLIDR